MNNKNLKVLLIVLFIINIFDFNIHNILDIIKIPLFILCFYFLFKNKN